MKDFIAWNMDIIHKDGEGYRAIITTDAHEEAQFGCFGEWYSWKQLSALIERATYIRIPKRKEFRFEKLSAFEQIAGIDASHIRPQGSLVTMQERQCGWMRECLD